MRVGSRRRALIAEAVVDLLAARLALIFVPFPRLSRRFGTLVPPTDPRVAETGAGANLDQIWIAEEVGWAVTRAARHVPFKAVCLPQAMAGYVMLKRRGVASVMHIGADTGSTPSLAAHAWLDAAGVEVTGYPIGERLAEIACFVGQFSSTQTVLRVHK